MCVYMTMYIHGQIRQVVFTYPSTYTSNYYIFCICATIVKKDVKLRWSEVQLGDMGRKVIPAVEGCR